MGNDGGSIPTRRELVKEAARNPTTTELKESQHNQQEYHWSTDPVSLEPLVSPVVSDSAGKLYNKATILEFLVESKRKDDVERISLGAIKSLKDVVEVKFHLNDDVADKKNDMKLSLWTCPVTGDRLGPGSRAVYVVPCGHAFSASAIKETASSSLDTDNRCLTCDTAFAPNDVIPILPTATTDIARLSLRAKTLQEQGLSHSLKRVAGAGVGNKKRKKKRTGEGEDMVGHNAAEKDETSNGHATDFSAAATESAKSSVRINNVSTASLTAKVMEESERAKKRRMNDNVSSLFSTRDQSKPLGKSSDFMSRGYSMPAASKNH